MVGGIAWAALPHDFPPAKTIYGLYLLWVETGAWLHPRRLARPGRRRHEGRDPAPAAAIIGSQSLLGADMSRRLARTGDW